MLELPAIAGRAAVHAVRPLVPEPEEAAVEIMVIGAGLSGLALAAAMRRKAPEVRVTVCERDPSAFSRPQGYAIGIKGDTGVPALRELDLEQRVFEGDTVRVTDFVFTDQRGRSLLELRPARDDDRNLTLRIQRTQLKNALLEAVGDGAGLRYGHGCTGIEAVGDRVTAILDDNRRIEADYLVGCDGVASAVRAQIVGDAPRFLGLTAIYGDAPIQPDHPLLSGGYFITLGRDGSSFFCYTQPGGSVHFSYTLHSATPGTMGAASQDGLLSTVGRRTDGWFDLVRQVVDAADVGSVGVRDYYDRDPIGSVRYGRVWLVGDAAHPMAPFQGQGANCGLLHAVRLADYFAAARKDPAGAEPLAGRVEAELVRRGRGAVLESRKRARQLHTTSAFSRAMRDGGFRMGNAMMKLMRRG
jgi:2-polyprenyl-6-methoxyphenol hydroxylase-like FAD-dependent oxidoreductase